MAIKIIDHRGEELERDSLEEEQATQTLTGIRTVWHESIANQLTPERLAAVMLAVDQNGEIDEYLTLAQEMEERDLHYASVLRTRRLAVSRLPIVVEAVSDDKMHVEQADFVRDVMSDEDLIRPMLSDQLDALGKGFSADEIMWDRDGSNGSVWIPKGYKWRDPRFFQFDRLTGDILRVRDEEDMIDGVPLKAYRYIVHRPQIKAGLTIRGGLARLAAVAFMCKGYSMKDWLAFAEVYGLPLRVGKYGAGSSKEQRTALLRAVANIGTDAAAIIPDSMEIEFIDGARSGGGIGESVFERLCNWLDRQVSKGVLGQTMTTDDGSSRSQAEVHDEVRSDIKESDAAQLSATLRRDLVKPLVDLNKWGPQKRGQYPIVRLQIEEIEDLESLAKSLPIFIDRGLRVEESVVLDKFGLEVPEDDAVLLKPKGVVSSSDPAAEPPAQARSIFATQSQDDAHEIWVMKIDYAELEDATRWLAAHGYKTTMTRETDTDRIFMQRPKTDFTDMPFWQLPVTRGVRALVGRLKEKSFQNTQRALGIALMHKVLAGEELTQDQRSLLATFQQSDSDRIDKLVDEEMGGWQQIMDPMLQPIIELAAQAESYDEFIAGLDALSKNMDVDPLVQSLATATLKARGLGDRLDKV